MPFPRCLAVYCTAAATITWPLVLHMGTMVPGAERTDLWNALWSLWFFQDALWQGHPLTSTMLLGHPTGGRLLVADPVNAVLAAPLIPLLGLVGTYSVLVLFHLVFAGWAAHSLARELTPLPGAGWIAGLAYMAAPVTISAIQNGTSESIASGWLPLALLAVIRAIRRPGPVRILAAIAAVVVCALASWYGAVCLFLALIALLVLGEGSTTLKRRSLVLLIVSTISLIPVFPIAGLAQETATGQDSLVGIKDQREVASVRRSTGPADPVGWFAPWDYRSPDFRFISRYSEDFIHCHYLGWLLVVGSLLTAAMPGRRRGLAWLYVSALLGAVLAMGPVLCRQGQPVVFLSNLAIPLPYLLLERLPGLSSLSLLFRLGQLPSLCISLLGAIGLAAHGSRPRTGSLMAAVLVFVELRVVAPTHGLPQLTDATPPSPIQQLAEAPEGAVMNFPVAGGRRYLYEQTIHHKALAASLNFPNNRASRAVWKAMLASLPLAGTAPEQYMASVRSVAYEQGVRYLVVHVDPMARPDMHDSAVRALKSVLVPMAQSHNMRIYDLWANAPQRLPGTSP